MLSCDRNKTAIDGPSLARLTQRNRGVISAADSVTFARRQGLGIPVDPATAMQAASGAVEMFRKIGDFFGGLFGKDPDKVQFDSVRQNVWNQFAEIVDAVDALYRQNRLDAPTLYEFQGALGELIGQFDAYYQRVRDAVGASWGDSRFADFYDPMLAKYQEWGVTLKQGTLPTTAFTIPGTDTGISGTNALLLGAFALAIFSGLRGKGRSRGASVGEI